MGNADEIFKMLCEYLSMLGIDATTEVLFVSDGATWLWEQPFDADRTFSYPASAV